MLQSHWPTPTARPPTRRRQTGRRRRQAGRARGAPWVARGGANPHISSRAVMHAWLRGRQHAWHALQQLASVTEPASLPAYPVFRNWRASSYSLLLQAGWASQPQPAGDGQTVPLPVPAAADPAVDPTRGFVRGGHSVAHFSPDRIRNFSIIGALGAAPAPPLPCLPPPAACRQRLRQRHPSKCMPWTAPSHP
jgi:hypothetical protein